MGTTTLDANGGLKQQTSLKRERRGLKFEFRSYWPYYVMAIPGIIFFIVFRYVPLGGSVIAFQDYSVINGIGGSPWVGWDNFKMLFNYPDFQLIFRNTLLMGLYRTIFTFPVPILLALMINEVRKAIWKKTVQTAIYIPHFLSWVVVAGLTFDLLGASGLFNQLRGLLGYEDSMLVMQMESWFRTVFVGTSIWKEAGWGTVVYLAAISAIDPTLYESASIDGASMFQRMRLITLPLMMPTVITLFLLGIGSFLDLGFEQVFNLLTPMTYSVGDIFDTYVFRVGIQQAQYSLTTAVGLFQSVIGFVLVYTFNKIASKVSDGGLW